MRDHSPQDATARRMTRPARRSPQPGPGHSRAADRDREDME
ncbi:hypothetical protein SAMN05421538_109114 [Paracoccus isoporae]|uniref:Uncharacterized protein n=1 Tax=Paracoccus isoporae TaxID=591205 RepID=A0A1G7EXX5_9RHOB|nr:hypothetical protein SAMN05421538_109114 [Paracoccus isoporae]